MVSPARWNDQELSHLRLPGSAVSWQNPLAQSSFCTQGCPSACLHAPDPSHAWVVSHCPGSTPLRGMYEHAPTFGGRLHAAQMVVQEVSQQYPSTQAPERHSAPPPHTLPLFFLQSPAPSQALPLVHAPISAKAGSGVHVPAAPAALHFTQSPSHALSQHTSSAQNPLRHS